MLSDTPDNTPPAAKPSLALLDTILPAEEDIILLALQAQVEEPDYSL